MQYQKTNKLFYKKWPFKVECYLKGASRVKYNGCDEVIAWCEGTHSPKHVWWEAKDIDKLELRAFAYKVKNYLEKDLQIRVENSRYNFYCKDRDLFNSLISDFSQWIKVVTEPFDDSEYQYLLDNSTNKILCDEYPWNGYRYKVVIRDTMPIDSRIQFIGWLQNYAGKIRIAGASLGFMIGSKRWMQDPFIYVKDRNTLTMVGLYLGNHCKKTHEYILKSSINTPCLH